MGNEPVTKGLDLLEVVKRCEMWLSTIAEGRKMQLLCQQAITDAERRALERASRLLQWSEIRQPNDRCHYTHVEAVSPIGRFLLTWKGWKTDAHGYLTDTPTLDVSPWMHDVTAPVYFGDTPENAMKGVGEELARRLEAMESQVQ